MKKIINSKELNNLRLISKLSEEDFQSALILRNDIKKEKLKSFIFAGYSIISLMLIVSCLLSKSFLFAAILAVSWIIVFLIRRRRMPLDISIYFGLPGAGKTTIAAAESLKYRKKGFDVYSNVNLYGCKKIDKEDLGNYNIENALIILDEASIMFNNRDFKTMSHETIEFLKYHRHYKTKIIVFSQSYDDMDITFRRLAYHYYFVRRSIIPGLINCIPIRRDIGINDMTKEICDEYKIDPLIFRIFTTKRYWGKKYWHLFDTYEKPELPEKEEWPIWGKDDDKPIETSETDWYY